MDIGVSDPGITDSSRPTRAPKMHTDITKATHLHMIHPETIERGACNIVVKFDAGTGIHSPPTAGEIEVADNQTAGVPGREAIGVVGGTDRGAILPIGRKNNG